MGAVEAFWEAFLAAQSEMPNIPKNRAANIATRDGGSFSYKFADFNDVVATVAPILHKHDLTYTQSAISEGDRVGVETRIAHKAGHVESSGALLLESGGDARGAGSAITYAKRYALLAALGIAAEDDDDGGAASKPAPDGTGRGAAGSSSSYQCPDSGHGIYDNRESNIQRVADGGKAWPAFKCQDKSCGWVSWDDGFFDPQPIREDYDAAPPPEFPPGEEPF